MQLTPPKKKDKVRNIVILAHPYSTLFNISSPVEVFQMAIDQMIETNVQVNFTYEIHVVSAVENKTIDVKPQISINCECSYYEINYPIDTLIVIGSPRVIGYKREVLDWLQNQSKNVRRICSMCAGAFTLAEAGILNNKKAVTHWQLCNELAIQYPAVDVSQDAIFVKHNNVYTSAGVSAGLDLSLALIEEDLGKAFALRIAKLMVLFLKRPGNQTQYSVMLESQKTDYEPI
ncbi:MAG: AraC family transcriptional regulator, partial [Chryseobacterium sp.]